MVSIEEYKQDIPLLVESGLIAIKQGDEQSAKKIFDAVGVLDPKNTAKKMGYGLIALHKMETLEAQKYFKEVLAIEKDNYRAQAFLGLTYLLSVMDEKVTDKKEKLENLKKGTDLANNVIDNADVESTKELAQSVLEWEKQIYEQTTSPRGPAG